MRYTESRATPSKNLPKVKDRAEVWSEQVILSKVDGTVHVDEQGTQYIRYYSVPDRPDWP